MLSILNTLTIAGFDKEVFWPSFSPVVGTNLAELNVKMTVKGMSVIMKSSAKATARALLKKSLKRNGGLLKRGKGKKQRPDEKPCPCGSSTKKRKNEGKNQKKKECVDFRLLEVWFSNDLTIYKDQKGSADKIKRPQWKHSSLISLFNFVLRSLNEKDRFQKRA